MDQNIDEYFITRCTILAKKGLGLVSPNPLVGALIVKNSEIIGEGFHQKFGGAHAEVDAFLNSNVSPVGGTLYCNLEPCCHTNKKTPPCVNLIIKNQIKKVVIGALDPNPHVSGKGVEALRASGIEVVTNVLQKECEDLNQAFFKYIKLKVPYVHLKVAMTLDGKIAKSDKSSKWISNEGSRKEVHRLRLKYDAIAVGINTALIDNPTLDIRMGIDSNGKIPFKIIYGFRKDLFNLNIYKQNPEKLIVVAKKIEAKSLEKLEKANVTVINSTNLETSLSEIGKLNISSILVEGGAKLFSSFVCEKLFDKISIFTAPKFFLKGLPLFEDCDTDLNLDIQNPRFRIIDDNVLTEGVSNVYRSC